MLGVTWVTASNKWRLYFDGINTDGKELEKLALKIQEKITAKKKGKNFKICGINLLTYKNKTIILYNTLEEPFTETQTFNTPA